MKLNHAGLWKKLNVHPSAAREFFLSVLRRKVLGNSKSSCDVKCTRNSLLMYLGQFLMFSLQDFEAVPKKMSRRTVVCLYIYFYILRRFYLVTSQEIPDWSLPVLASTALLPLTFPLGIYLSSLKASECNKTWSNLPTADTRLSAPWSVHVCSCTFALGAFSTLAMSPLVGV